MANIRDVARAAGVSPATVSRTFATPNLINAQTQKRVMEIARQLNYRPPRLRSAKGETTPHISNTLLSSDLYPALRENVEQNLRIQVLAPWYPRALDNIQGGFFEVFDETWNRSQAIPNTKSVVYQSRLTWMAAKAAQHYPEEKTFYSSVALQGLKCLSDRIWDSENGGFYWNVSETNTAGRNGEKHAYGIAFAIYAASAVHEMTQETGALDLAKEAYLWLENHAHDADHGGYYEALDRYGDRLLTARSAPAPQRDPIGMRYGYKSMNGHIHLLEAFTALYTIWPDAGLRGRLEELLTIVRDKIVVEPGCQNLFFTLDWRALPNDDSFGHDVETAYLITEASGVLGRPEDSATWKIARQLVDHALDVGWDDDYGGFYDSGPAFGKATATDKIGWVQAEGMNALLRFHSRYGKETPVYGAAFLRQWDFILKHQIDYRNTGWYSSVRREGTPFPQQLKSDAWRDPYHQGRALMNVSKMLHKLAL